VVGVMRAGEGAVLPLEVVASGVGLYDERRPGVGVRVLLLHGWGLWTLLTVRVCARVGMGIGSARACSRRPDVAARMGLVGWTGAQRPPRVARLGMD